MKWQDRYRAAHLADFKVRYPLAYKDGHYSDPVYPKVKTANGLTAMIVNFLNWSGHRATRINVQGRMIEGVQTQDSGVRLRTKKFLKSSTRKGSADVSSTIKGRSWMWEIKAGRDKPSPEQMAEQERERRAGGQYEFIHDPEEFFFFYDKIM